MPIGGVHIGGRALLVINLRWFGFIAHLSQWGREGYFSVLQNDFYLPRGLGGVGWGGSATCGFYPNNLFPSLYLPSHISSPRMASYFSFPPVPPAPSIDLLLLPPIALLHPTHLSHLSLLPILLSIPPATSSPISFLPHLPPHSPSSLCLRHSILQLP